MGQFYISKIKAKWIDREPRAYVQNPGCHLQLFVDLIFNVLLGNTKQYYLITYLHNNISQNVGLTPAANCEQCYKARGQDLNILCTGACLLLFC